MSKFKKKNLLLFVTVLRYGCYVGFIVYCRTLGSIACIISERKNAHHSVVNGLDSHDAVEVDAAIYAADKFSAMSKWVITGTKKGRSECKCLHVCHLPECDTGINYELNFLLEFLQQTSAVR